MIDPKKVEQGSDEWHLLRLGHVTASNISDVMAKGKSGEAITRKKYKTKLLAERLTGQKQESFSSSAMEWGVEQEQFARMAYEVSNDVLVDKTGFWHHPTIKWVGVSPDGLVDNDGLVEIKCPNTTTHLDYIMDNKVPTDYYKQIQCQLWATGKSWCDFVSYDPRLPTKNQLFVKRCMRDEKLIAEMENEVLIFLAEIDEMIKFFKGNE